MQITDKFLIIETFHLGDLLYLGPLLSVVRVAYPDSQIEVLASDATQGFPFFEQLKVSVHHFNFPWCHLGWHKQPLKLIQAAVALRRKFGQQFKDHVILDPRGDIRHTFTAQLISSRKFIQYHSSEKFNEALRGIYKDHIFACRQEFFRQIAGECGLSSKAVLPWPWLMNFKQNLGERGMTVLLAPEASNHLRYWKSERWKLLANRLHQNGWRTTLIVHRGDAVSDIDPDDFDMVWRGSLADLGKLVMCSQAMIAVDSFSGHLAAAMDIPVVSLFGAQSPALWRPWGEKTAVVVADGYPCRPCDQKYCVHPNDNCMDAIQVNHVLQTFEKLIERV